MSKLLDSITNSIAAAHAALLSYLFGLVSVNGCLLADDDPRGAEAGVALEGRVLVLPTPYQVDALLVTEVRIYCDPRRVVVVADPLDDPDGQAIPRGDPLEMRDDWLAELPIETLLDLVRHCEPK